MNKYVRWWGGGGKDSEGKAGVSVGGHVCFSTILPDALASHLFGTAFLSLTSLVSASLTPLQGTAICYLLWEGFLNS